MKNKKTIVFGFVSFAFISIILFSHLLGIHEFFHGLCIGATIYFATDKITNWVFRE